jgi:eukaryotic-like serine/threonine-protein kinase
MSPEQFRGERATAKSDQFGFCVAVYSAVYGQAPFEGENLIEIGQAVTGGLLRPPPRGTEAPDWLWPLLERGLSHDAEDRFPTMAALLDAIEDRLPRAPDLDPAATRRERGTAFFMLGAQWVLTTGYIAWQGPRALATPWHLVGVSTSLLTVSALSVAFLWKGLKKNVHGRLLAGLFLSTPATILVHRLVAVRLGTPPRHVLVVDTLLLTCVFTMAALTLDRRLAVVTVVGLAATATGALYQAATPWLFGGFTIFAILVGVRVSKRLR